MKKFRIESEPEADAEIKWAVTWYESEVPGLGIQFLEELRAAYERLQPGPLKYRRLRGDIRRALTQHFPYAIYFSVEDDLILILTVLHVARDPAEWQKFIE